MMVPVVLTISRRPDAMVDPAAAPTATPWSGLPSCSNCFMRVNAMGIDGDRRLYWGILSVFYVLCSCVRSVEERIRGLGSI